MADEPYTGCKLVNTGWRPASDGPTACAQNHILSKLEKAIEGSMGRSWVIGCEKGVYVVEAMGIGPAVRIVIEPIKMER